MKRLTVIGARSKMKNIINELYDLKSFHIDEFKNQESDDVFESGRPFEENETYSELIVKVRTVKQFLKISGNKETSMDIKEKEVITKINNLFSQVGIIERKIDYFKKIKDVIKKQKQVQALKVLDEDLASINKKHFLCYIGFYYDDPEKDIAKVTKKYELLTSEYDGLKILALYADKEKRAKIKKALENHEFIEIESPFINTVFPELKGSIGIPYGDSSSLLDRLNMNLDKLREEIDVLAEKNERFLLAADNYLSSKIEVAEAPLKFATSENSFVIKGWVPSAKEKDVIKQINKIAKGYVYVISEEVGKHENVPIAFDHPKAVEPFEFFMNLYTLPNYQEFDPTYIMFLTFPLFFGFMLGDIGYGLVTFALFWLLKKKLPEAKNILNAFMFASVATIIFGLLFGEIFGLEEFTLNGTHIALPHILSRAHQINDLLTIAILIGVIHIVLGFVIGFINVYKEHNFMHAMYEKGGWLMLIPGVLYILGALGVLAGTYGEFVTSLLPPLPMIGVLSLISIVFIYKGEGAKGIIELPAILSNILSYARLMAVGLASVSLAVVVNDLAGQLFTSGIFGVIMGIFVLVLGHMINIALGILSPFLHSLRLHYVEFFSKFFHGGGMRFKAFGNKNN